MATKQDVWPADRNAPRQKKAWFSKLPTLQKISYALLLMFIIGWCFYLGMTYAFAIAPDIEWEILRGDEWKQELKERTGEEVVSLAGSEVALLVGIDKRPGETRYRTDTIMLAFYNSDTDKLQILSIPRDTYVQFPGEPVKGRPTKTKINEAYFYGGIALLESVIEYTFGFEVDHCVAIDFSGFLQLIDALGGVEIDVPSRMYKPTEEIDLQKGLQTLNGYNALAFVRFRDLPMGDIDRIANQQMFIRALAAKIAQSSIFKAPELVNIGLEYTNTNYSITEALTLGAALYKTELADIPMYSLPGAGLYMLKGKDWINFWVLDKQGVMDIMTEITDGKMGDLHIIDDNGQGLPYLPLPEPEEELDDELTEETEQPVEELIEEAPPVEEPVVEPPPVTKKKPPVKVEPPVEEQVIEEPETPAAEDVPEQPEETPPQQDNPNQRPGVENPPEWMLTPPEWMVKEQG